MQPNQIQPGSPRAVSPALLQSPLVQNARRAAREALVLEATRRALAGGYPFTIDLLGLQGAADRMAGLVHDEFEEGKAFCATVRAHFYLLACRGGVRQ